MIHVHKFMIFRPSIQPNKSAIKTGSEADKLEKSKKVSSKVFFPIPFQC